MKLIEAKLKIEELMLEHGANTELQLEDFEYDEISGEVVPVI